MDTERLDDTDSTMKTLDDLLEDSYLMKRKRIFNQATAKRICSSTKVAKKKMPETKDDEVIDITKDGEILTNQLEGTVMEWPSEDEKSNSSVKVKREPDCEPKKKRWVKS